MTMEPRFRWTCSFAGCVDFEVTGDGERYKVEMRMTEPCEYWLRQANGDDVRRDMRQSVGLLIRRGGRRPGFGIGEVSPAVLDAFNRWRLADHRRHVAELDARPDKYGHIAADDPLRRDPLVAWRGRYVIGEGWQR